MSEDAPIITDPVETHEEIPESPAALTYEEAVTRVNELSDSLGHPIDEQIKAPLIALWMNGINTTGSCEGHKDWGLPYPWIDIEAPEPQGWEEDAGLQEQWRQANFAEHAKIKALLDEFYSQFPSDHPLFLSEMGIYGSHRLQPIGDYGSDFEHIDRSREEMQRFCQFLMEKASAANHS